MKRKELLMPKLPLNGEQNLVRVLSAVKVVHSASPSFQKGKREMN